MITAERLGVLHMGASTVLNDYPHAVSKNGLAEAVLECHAELIRIHRWLTWMQTDAAQTADPRVIAEAMERGDEAPKESNHA